jgi:hypothetical protein
MAILFWMLWDGWQSIFGFRHEGMTITHIAWALADTKKGSWLIGKYGRDQEIINLVCFPV